MKRLILVGMALGAAYALALPVLAGDPPPLLHPNPSQAADPSASPGELRPDPSVIVIPRRTAEPQKPTGGGVTIPPLPPTDTEGE